MANELIDEKALAQILEKYGTTEILQNKNFGDEIKIDIEGFINSFKYIQLSFINFENKSQQEQNSILRNAFALVQSFHTFLTGETLFFSITSGDTRMAERIIPWQKLIGNDILVFNIKSQELKVSLTALNKALQDQKIFDGMKRYSVVEQWKIVRSWFEGYPYKEYTNIPKSLWYKGISSKKLHQTFQKINKDTDMYGLWATSEDGKKQFIYTIKDQRNIQYLPAFNGGNIKEWFDEIMYQQKSKKQWWNYLQREPHPMQYIIYPNKKDTDKGLLLGDIRLTQDKILQVKWNNEVLFSKTQIVDNCTKILNLLVNKEKKSNDEIAQQLNKLFLESGAPEKLSQQIATKINKHFKNKNIKI